MSATLFEEIRDLRGLLSESANELEIEKRLKNELHDENQLLKEKIYKLEQNVSRLGYELQKENEKRRDISEQLQRALQLRFKLSSSGDAW